MPPIHHQWLVEAVEADLCWGLGWGCSCLLVGFRFFLARLLFLGIISPSVDVSLSASHGVKTGARC